MKGSCYELIHIRHCGGRFRLTDELVARWFDRPNCQFDVISAATQNDAIWLYDMHLAEDLPRNGDYYAKRETLATFLNCDDA